MQIVRRLQPIMAILTTLMLTITLIAQDNCPVIVRDAFDQVADACSDLSRNDACYGSNNVQASFYNEVDDDFFTLPGDLSVIDDIETIATVPLDRDANLWGIALLQVQANLPDTLPGQNVIFILLGNAQLTDDVAGDANLPAAEPIAATVTTSTNVRSGASLRNNVIATLSQGTTVTVDGLSRDQNWARVSFDERAGWIFTQLLDADLSGLPVVQGLNLAPMQAFHLSTGIGAPDCVEAPDAVLVQGTEDYEIEFVANGAEVRIGSTALLQMVAEDRMQIMMLDGAGFVDDLRIPAGWKAQIEINPEGGESDATDQDGLPEARGAWLDCTRLDDTDLATIESLTNLPQSILNYPITVPGTGNEPCQSPTIPVSTGGGAPASQVSSVDCSSFEFLGPASNLSPRPQQYSWTDAPGADEYELVFFSVINQSDAGNFRTRETSIVVNLGEVPTGSEVIIEVRAYANGQYACTTARTPIITLVADPEGGGSGGVNAVPGVFTASWSCTTPSPTSADVTVAWANAPAGTTTITVDFIDLGSGVGYNRVVGVPPPDNSTTFIGIPTTPGFPDYGNGTVTASPGGQVIALSPANLDCN